MKKILIILAFLSGLSLAQNYQPPNNDADCPNNCRMIPWSGGTDLWNGGVLPSYTPITCTLTGNGTTNDGPALQTCLNNLANQQCAFIAAGTYLINSNVNIPSNKEICGASPFGFPFLPTKTTGITYFNFGASGVITLGSGRTLGSNQAIVSGYVKGSQSITMAAGHGFATGNWIVLSEGLDAEIPVTPVGADGTCTWCGAGEDSVHIMTQIVQITNVSGNNITLSRPLYYTFKSTLNPVARTTTMSTVKAGIRNVRLDGSAVDHGNPFITGTGCAFCWISDVETYVAGSGAKDAQFYLYYSYGAEIRNSYFHQGRNYSSDRTYGMYGFGPNSDFKIENNISRINRHNLVLEGGGSGFVYLYNYSDDGFTDDPTYLGESLTNHGAHPYMNLYEGNILSHLIADNFWGSSSHIMEYRDSKWGNESSAADLPAAPSLDNAGPLEVWPNNHYYTFIGNVLGRNGAGMVANPNFATYTLRNVNCTSDPTFDIMYQYGCNPFSGGYDAAAGTTSLNHGNWDLKTAGVAYWEGGANHNLAPSLYYVSQPTSWWKVGNYVAPWPPIGPDVTGGNVSGTGGKVYQNPAMACFNSTLAVCYSASGVAVATPTFNPLSGTYNAAQDVAISTTTGGATICYTTDGSDPTTDGAGNCTHGSVYSTTIHVVLGTTTIKAIGTISGGTDSSIGSATYNIIPISVTTPVFIISQLKENQHDSQTHAGDVTDFVVVRGR